jgi:UDP-N-acetyl-D-mannosaminuronic acid dehydrogenase
MTTTAPSTHRVELETAIDERSARMVVVGLGYVGLPVAALFAKAGFPVVGLDVQPNKVDQVNRGVSPIEGDEPGLDELVAEVVHSGKLTASCDERVCAQAQVILVAVETPVDDATHKPAYVGLRAALESIGRNMAAGTLVIIESTVAPGTMQRLAAPTLEAESGLLAGRDFFLVHCPERLMPGKLLANIRQCPRVVGGATPACARLAQQFYQMVVQGELDLADVLTAELVKTMENAYRDVQIAFANEMALLCEDLGADVWQVRDLVNKSPGRHMLLPGAGVGGHCIPKDPWLLIANASAAFQPRLVPAARAVNDGMPLHVAELAMAALQAAGIAPSEAKVAVLGYAYLENSDDTRNSPSAVLVARLRAAGVEVVIHDPYVPEYQGDLIETVRGSHALALMVGHAAYRTLDLAALRAVVAHPLLIDGRHILSLAQASAPGWSGMTIGVPWSGPAVVSQG